MLKRYTIKDVVEKVANTMCISKEEIQWDDTMSDGCMKKTVTSKKFQKIYDFEFTSLNVGLKLTYDWFIKNKDTLRK